MNYGLSNDAIPAIIRILRQYDTVEQAVLYGSRAMGKYRPASDIDLVLIGPELKLSVQLSIENAIDDLLLPYTVDLSILHQIENAELLDHINRAGIVIYEKRSV